MAFEGTQRFVDIGTGTGGQGWTNRAYLPFGGAIRDDGQVFLFSYRVHGSTGIKPFSPSQNQGYFNHFPTGMMGASPFALYATLPVGETTVQSWGAGVVPWIQEGGAEAVDVGSQTAWFRGPDPNYNYFGGAVAGTGYTQPTGCALTWEGQEEPGYPVLWGNPSGVDNHNERDGFPVGPFYGLDRTKRYWEVAAEGDIGLLIDEDQKLVAVGSDCYRTGIYQGARALNENYSFTKCRVMTGCALALDTDGKLHAWGGAAIEWAIDLPGFKNVNNDDWVSEQTWTDIALASRGPGSRAPIGAAVNAEDGSIFTWSGPARGSANQNTWSPGWGYAPLNENGDGGGHGNNRTGWNNSYENNGNFKTVNSGFVKVVGGNGWFIAMNASGQIHGWGDQTRAQLDPWGNLRGGGVLDGLKKLLTDPPALTFDPGTGETAPYKKHGHAHYEHWDGSQAGHVHDHAPIEGTPPNWRLGHHSGPHTRKV